MCQLFVASHSFQCISTTYLHTVCVSSVQWSLKDVLWTRWKDASCVKWKLQYEVNLIWIPVSKALGNRFGITRSQRILIISSVSPAEVFLFAVSRHHHLGMTKPVSHQISPSDIFVHFTMHSDFNELVWEANSKLDTTATYPPKLPGLIRRKNKSNNLPNQQSNRWEEKWMGKPWG